LRMGDYERKGRVGFTIARLRYGGIEEFTPVSLKIADWILSVTTQLKTHGNETGSGQSQGTSSVDDKAGGTVSSSASRRRRGGGRVGFGSVNTIGSIGERGGGDCAVLVGGIGAAVGDTDGLRCIGGEETEVGWRRAFVVKGVGQGGTNSHGIGSTNTKTGGSRADFLDEVTHFVDIQVHVSMYFRHGGASLVILEDGRRVLLRASEERSKDLVQVSNQGVLVAGIIVGRSVVLQGGSSTSIEEVHGNRRAIHVGAQQATVEVL
jgi:hypothetical protein